MKPGQDCIDAIGSLVVQAITVVIGIVFIALLMWMLWE